MVCCLIRPSSANDLTSSEFLVLDLMNLYITIVITSDLFPYRDDSLISYRVIIQTKQQTKCLKPLQTLRAWLFRQTCLPPLPH